MPPRSLTGAHRLPVVVATGQVTERTTVASALELAARAAATALDLAPRLRASIDRVTVVRTMSDSGPHPATALARALGISPARAEVTAIGGNSPQSAVNRAAAAIAAGELDTVLVVGAEAQRSARLRATAANPVPPAAHDGPHDTPAPDPVVGDDRSGAGPAELNAGLVAPLHVYTLFESVLARRAGRSPAEHRAVLGELLAPFTRVAAANPYAWFPTVRSPSELAEVTPDNRLVAEPYPKRMCAFWSVDQAAAVVVTSLGRARRAGVDERAVYCWSGADTTDVWFPSARPDLGRSPALHAAVAGALGAAGLGVDDVGAFDFYSCFPCVLEMAVEALGLAHDDRRGLTVTGGLPYFGGPGNDYSLHAIATMVERLRERGGTGLVTALGWYVTKHSAGVYGASAPPKGWRLADTADAQRAIDASALPVADAAEGPADVVASSVGYGTDGQVTAAPVVARLADGRRIAAAAEVAELPALAGRNLVGERIWVAGTTPRYRITG